MDKFKEVSEILRGLIKFCANKYRGYHQIDLIKVAFCALITHDEKGSLTSVLLEGPHGGWRTSLISLICNLFSKETVFAEAKFRTWEEREKAYSIIAETLQVDKEMLSKNLIYGINSLFVEECNFLKVTLIINRHLHPKAENIGEPWRIRIERKPLNVYSKQITSIKEFEEIVGITLDLPPLLGQKPPHLQKSDKLPNADIAIFDECYKDPIILVKLLNILSQKTIDSSLGNHKIYPLAIFFITNPRNENYGTNVPIDDFAIADRFTYYCWVEPPTPQQVIETKERDIEILNDKIPIEILYEARELVKDVEIPSSLLAFIAAFLASLSNCYFTLSNKKRGLRRGPFCSNKDCNLCIYGQAGQSKYDPNKGELCSKMNLTVTRAMLSIIACMKAHAFIYGRRMATIEDLEFALLHTLPHRGRWNEHYLRDKGDVLSAMIDLINQFKEVYRKYKEDYLEIAKLNMKVIESIEKGSIPEITEFKHLRDKYFDFPPLRAYIDNIGETIKEWAIKHNERKTLKELDPNFLDLSDVGDEKDEE